MALNVTQNYIDLTVLLIVKIPERFIVGQESKKLRRSYFVLNIDNNNGDGDYDYDDDDGGGGGDDDDDEKNCDGDRLIGRHYIRFHWVKYFSKTSSLSI